MKKIMNVMAKVLLIIGIITTVWCFVSMIQLIAAGNLTINMLEYVIKANVLLPAMPFGASVSLLWAEKEMEKEEEES